MPRSYTLEEAYRSMYLREFGGAFTATTTGLFGIDTYNDEYRNAILQGYSPEMAAAKAATTVAADIGGDLGGELATTAIPGVNMVPGATLLASWGTGEAARRAAGDWFDRQNKKGKYQEDGKGKPWHGYDAIESLDPPADPPGWLMSQMKDDKTKAADATAQRNALGVVKGGNAGYAVLDKQKEGESAEAYRERMKRANELADRLNKEEGLGKYRTNAQAEDPRQTDDQQTDDNSDPETQGQQGDQQSDQQSDQQPDEQGEQGDEENKDTFDISTRPGESMKAKQDRLLKDKDYKDLTPTQQWAINHPQLAAKVRPGAAGYEEIQKVSDYIKQPKGGAQQQGQQNTQSASTAGNPPDPTQQQQAKKTQSQPKTEAQKAAELKKKQEEQLAKQRQQASQRQAQLQRQQAMGTQRVQQQAQQRVQQAAQQQQRVAKQQDKQQQQPGIQPPAAQTTPNNTLRNQFQQRRTQIAQQNKDMMEGLLDYLLQ